MLMMRLDNRLPLLILVSVATVLLAVGCTTRPDETETIVMQGNHSAGDLMMVTADTSSDGFQYLDPDISPDGSRIAFTADWASILPFGEPPDPLPYYRQIAISPTVVQDQPLLGLAPAWLSDPETHDSYGECVLVLLAPVRYVIGGSGVTVYGHEGSHKGDPDWIDDDNLLFWMTGPRGARIFRANVPYGLTTEDEVTPEVLYREVADDSLFARVPFWEHLSPSLSPDGNWVAFSRFGYVDTDSLATVTKQSIWVFRMPDPGQTSDLAFQITGEAAQVDGPSWAPDGRSLAFHATLDLIGESNSKFTKEIFTVDFDTTGLAANGAVSLDAGLRRLTYSGSQEGSPIQVRNWKPVFSPDGTRIVFASDRRVPALTYTDANIWWIPVDGSLEPQIVFFTRYTEADPVFTGRSGDELLLSSALGFPTEMLDRLQAEAVVRIGELNPFLTEVQIEAEALAEREELTFFEGVMSHLYLLSNW